LIHKFRGLEIGGSIGNTNLGASNDARELEGWMTSTEPVPVTTGVRFRASNDEGVFVILATRKRSSMEV